MKKSSEIMIRMRETRFRIFPHPDLPFDGRFCRRIRADGYAAEFDEPYPDVVNLLGRIARDVIRKRKASHG